MYKSLFTIASIMVLGGLLNGNGSVPAQASVKPETQKVAVAESVTAPAPDPQPATPPQINVTVNAGDYLEKIADEHNTTYLRLFYANTAITNPDLIYPGQQLRIPAETEDLAARPLPVNAPAEAAAAVAVDANAGTQARAITTPVTTTTNFAAGDGSVWDKIAACESSGNWAISTGNGFYGGLQFTLGSWAAVGGSGNPANASREEQIARGQALQARQGWGAWPACSAKLGLR